MFKIFLPFITKRTFDKESLENHIFMLWFDAVNNMSKEFTILMQEVWTIGFTISGNTVLDYLWLEHSNRPPTSNELDEVAKAMVKVALTSYKYDKRGFFIMPEYPNRLYAILSSEA